MTSDIGGCEKEKDQNSCRLSGEAVGEPEQTITQHRTILHERRFRQRYERNLTDEGTSYDSVHRDMQRYENDVLVNDT